MEELLKLLNDSVKNFNSSLNVIQSGVLAEVELLIKDIVVVNGNVAQSVSNLKRINRLKEVINNVVISPEYKQRVIDFGKAFDTVTKIQEGYFLSLVNDFSAPEVLKEIKSLAVQDVVAGLTEQGIEYNVSAKISDILKRNIEEGSKYTDMVKELRTFIDGNKDTLGALEKHAETITTDSINQYAATYNKIVSDDLGLDWSMYVGALVGQSRDLCEALVSKKYVHKSELQDIVKGKINGKQIPIYKKTGLPYGMIAGTNANNFQVRRGGHKCNHLLMPILDERVPEELRVKFDKKLKAVA